jgi:ketosteroid isomerase-like protein
MSGREPGDGATASMMSSPDSRTAASKAAVQRWFEAIDTNDADTFLASMTPDVHYQVMGSSILSGVQTMESLERTARLLYDNTVDGIKLEILTMTGEGDRVAVEFVGRATMTTGASYNNEYHVLFHVRDGKVCSIKEYMDTALVTRVFEPLLERRD